MSTPILDPAPRNELDKGTLAPELDSKLLAQDYAFAVQLQVPTQARPVIFCSKRSVEDAATDMVVSSIRGQRRRLVANKE